MKKLHIAFPFVTMLMACNIQDDIKASATKTIQDKISETISEVQQTESKKKNYNTIIDIQIGEKSFNEHFKEASGSAVAEFNRLQIEALSTDPTGYEVVKKVIVTLRGNKYTELKPMKGTTGKPAGDEAEMTISIQMMDKGHIETYLINDAKANFNAVNKELIELSFEGMGYTPTQQSDKSSWQPAKGKIIIKNPNFDVYTEHSNWMY